MRTRFNGQKNVVHEVQKMNEDTKKQASPSRAHNRKGGNKRDSSEKLAAG